MSRSPSRPTRPGSSLHRFALPAGAGFARRTFAAGLIGALLLAAGCGAAPVATARSAEPRNLTLLKQELAAYADSGAYARDLAAVAEEARAWIERRAGTPGTNGERLAVVFDLDETLLSNHGHMRAQNYGYVPAVWDTWVAEARAPAIEPVAEVYRTARAHGVTVFYVTGRRVSQHAATEENLRHAGLADHAELHCKPDNYAGTTEAFKTAVRRRLTQEGWVIIANLGDQHSDLAGGFAERTFKLPNPFYLIR